MKKRTETRHAEKMLKRTIEDQSYFVHIIRYLSNFTTTIICEKILLGSEDTEVLNVFSIG